MKKLASAVLFILSMTVMFFCLCSGAFAANINAPEVTETSAKANEITLTWKTVKGATGYKIYQKNENGKYVGVFSTSKTSYTVKNLEPNTEYEFKMRSYKRLSDKSKDFGRYGETVSAKTKLADIKGLKVKDATTKSVTVSWKAVDGAQSYRVYYKKAKAKSYTFYSQVTDTSCTINDLTDANGWSVRVYAKSKDNRSLNSNAITVYTVPRKAEKPTVSNRDGGSITITWNKSGSANMYYVYAATSKDGKYKQVGKTDKTTFTYTPKKPKTTYYFKIAAAVETDKQTSLGLKSAALKASTKNISISVPNTVRKGEYPEINVPYYNSKVKWKSSNKKVIVYKNNRLYAAGTGSATLTATYKDYKTSVKVTVTSPTVSYMSGVYDVTNKKSVFENRVNERCYPASITKLITALVALKYMDVNDTIVVGNELNMVEGLSSRCDIQKGEKFKLGDLLYGLLLPSGGDAAYTIAVNCARKVSGKPNMGYVEAKNYFVSLMNKYMKSIGATGTHCVNPHGYPVNGHYSTVHDLMLVAQKVLKNSTLKKITSTPSKYVKALTGKGRTWRTTNSLLVSYSSFYSPYAHGMKTGTVDDDYTGIISAATKDGRTIITVVIGCESYNARYYATHKLYNAYL